MKLSNIFREKEETIKSLFVRNLTAKGNDLEHYVPVSLPLNWESSGNAHNKFQKINVPDYEKFLIDFFERSGSNTNFPILIILGHVGSGKSSSIKYALSQASVCDGCPSYMNCDKDKSSRIIIDYLDFKSEIKVAFPLDVKVDRTQERIKRFWLYLIGKLDTSIDKYFHELEKTRLFLSWFMNNYSQDEFYELYTELYPFLDIIHTRKRVSSEFRTILINIFKNLKPNELAILKLYQIAFLRNENGITNNCNVLIFDNIDTLDPILQQYLAEFAFKANQLLGCKSVIPMRPQTLNFYEHATNMIDLKDHWSPDFKKVIDKRLELLGVAEKSDLSISLKKIIDVMWSDNRMREIILGTTGKSIRYGLRNVFNMLLSNVITTHSNGVLIDNIQFDTNKFFQAYFCSESLDEELYEDCFTSLLTIKKGKTHIVSNIKLRILYILHKTDNLSVTELKEHILKFGYDLDSFITAINDMLSPKKSLLYGKSLTSYDRSSLEKIVDDQIFPTDIGTFYFQDLIKYWLYCRECNVLVTDRVYNMESSINICLETIKTLTELDFMEIQNFIDNASQKEYLTIYDYKELSISKMLWNRMYADIKNAVKAIDKQNISFDIDRQHYLEDRFYKLLYQ